MNDINKDRLQKVTERQEALDILDILHDRMVKLDEDSPEILEAISLIRNTLKGIQEVEAELDVKKLKFEEHEHINNRSLLKIVNFLFKNYNKISEATRLAFSAQVMLCLETDAEVTQETILDALPHVRMTYGMDEEKSSQSGDPRVTRAILELYNAGIIGDDATPTQNFIESLK